MRTKNSPCPALSQRAGGQRAAPAGTLGGCPPFSGHCPPCLSLPRAPMSSCRPCSARAGRRGGGEVWRPCPWPGGWTQARPDKVKRGVGSAPSLWPGPVDGHESAQGASGSPDLTTGWPQVRPRGGLSSLGKAGTGQEESPAGVCQALTSFSILRNTASTSTQKAPLRGPRGASCAGLVIPLSIHRADAHPAPGCFPV